MFVNNEWLLTVRLVRISYKNSGVKKQKPDKNSVLLFFMDFPNYFYSGISISKCFMEYICVFLHCPSTLRQLFLFFAKYFVVNT